MFTKAWLDPKDSSEEGHDKQCILTFNNRVIWGPVHCHDNTVYLRDALHKADCRFDMIIMDNFPRNYYHTKYISVKKGDTLYLDKLSTHENMEGLCKAVYEAQKECDCGPSPTDLKSDLQKLPESKSKAVPLSQTPSIYQS